MNTELLLRVRAHILEEPKRLNMSNWVQDAKPGDLIFCGYEIGEPGAVTTVKDSEAPSCGTVACIAGWTCLLEGIEETFLFGFYAERHLSLTTEQGGELFYPENWKLEGAYDSYRHASTPAARAAIVASVIDDFILRYK